MRSLRPPPRMTPSDSEDPLDFFPSENQRTPAIRPSRAVQTAARWLVVLTNASRNVVRFAVALCARAVASLRAYRLPHIQVPRLRLPRLHLPEWRIPAWYLPALRLPRWHLPAWHLPSWRLPAWRLPTWRLPTWRSAASRLPGSRLPEWHFPERRLADWRPPEPQTSRWHDLALRSRVVADASNALAAALRITRRAPAFTIAISAFATGVVVGGSAVWLSGASRHAGVDPRRVQPAAAVSQAPPSLVATARTPSAADIALPASESRTAVPSAGPRRPQFRGSLVVSSRPSGASVFLNGRSVGTTPLVLRNQAAGSRAVRVAMDGYESWSSAVRVVADTETRLRAELKAQRSSALP